MSVHKRKCSSCKYFNESPLPGNGWCTHHKRQLSSEVRILVRKGELACRDPWGSDYWTSRVEGAVATDTEQAVRPAPPERLVAGPRADDQITSVTASLSDRGPGTSRPGAGDPVPLQETTPDDVIVSQPSMLPEDSRPTLSERTFERDRLDLNPNLPAHADQQERVRIIARGNRDAIVKARERVVLRRGGSGADQEADVPDATADAAEDRSLARHGDVVSDNVVGSDGFADGVDPPVSRRYGRRPREQQSGLTFPSRGYADPTPPVPPEEAGDRSRHSPLVSRRADADRFESVPEVKPDVALPKLREFLQSAASETEAREGSSQDSNQQPETSYDRVLQRARAIKTATQKERNARVIRNRPVARAAPVSLVSAPTTVHDDPALSNAPLAGSRRLHNDVEGDVEDVGASRDDVIPDDEPAHNSVFGAEEIAASFGDDENLDDELYADDDFPDERTDGRSFVGPQGSWWRGLSLGFRRRPQTYAAAVDDAHDQDDWSVDEFTADPSWSVDDRETSSGPERTFSFADADNRRVAAEPSAPLRDSRLAEEELIDYELTDEVLETSFADDTDRIQAESWREDRHPQTGYLDHDAGDADRSRQDSGFALNDRHDMDAFRAALFGSGQDDPVAPREPRGDGSQPRRYHGTPAMPYEQLPRQREERSPTHALPIPDRQRYVEEPAFDIRNFVEEDDDLLDMRVQIAPDVPRACQTCRNFRPSESGQRGWCTNDFAFTHRQMVNADDMPCQSSIGCWWLPSDESWMPAEDLLARENPTPLTDRLIARRHGRDIGDGRVRSELYVREM